MSSRTRSIAALRAVEVAYPSSKYAQKGGPDQLRCPPQFCEFQSEKSTSLLNRVCKQTEDSPFFPRKVMAAFVFFRIGLSTLSIEQRKKEKKGELSV